MDPKDTKIFWTNLRSLRQSGWRAAGGGTMTSDILHLHQWPPPATHHQPLLWYQLSWCNCRPAAAHIDGGFLFLSPRPCFSISNEATIKIIIMPSNQYGYADGTRYDDISSLNIRPFQQAPARSRATIVNILSLN